MLGLLQVIGLIVGIYVMARGLSFATRQKDGTEFVAMRFLWVMVVCCTGILLYLLFSAGTPSVPSIGTSGLATATPEPPQLQHFKSEADVHAYWNALATVEAKATGHVPYESAMATGTAFARDWKGPK